MGHIRKMMDKSVSMTNALFRDFINPNIWWIGWVVWILEAQTIATQFHFESGGGIVSSTSIKGIEDKFPFEVVSILPQKDK